MAAPVVDSVIELVRDTPLVRLRMGAPAEVWAKCEHLLPSCAIEDRGADAALARSGVARGGSVVLAATGSDAAALAVAAKLRGVKIVAAMPRSMALEKRSLLRALGVELVLTDAAAGMEGARETAARIASERGIARIDPATDDGARATATEIVSAMGTPDVLVVGVGSGATLRACASVMRPLGTRVVAVVATRPDTRIAGLAPHASVEGADETRAIDDDLAWRTARRLAREEGLLVGPSSGACVAAACAIAATMPATARIATILGDTGERYFSIAQFFQPEARA